MARLTRPDQIVWLDGSSEEKDRLTRQALNTGEMIELNPDLSPGCLLHRSDVNDVARVEDLTFICSGKREDAGPTNNWMAPSEAYDRLGRIFDGSMKGRTMYVIPYLMGPEGSPFSRVGVELTDSLYVALSMRIMTRAGRVAMDRLAVDGSGAPGTAAGFVRGLHSKADLDPRKRFICHFPEDQAIWSVGSGYGGNALLGKKCFALRIASHLGRLEGWMAEHMLLIGVEAPDGEVTYIAGAFPSACGKTNLAMLEAPLSQRGYRVWTLGDDIVWMHVGEDGRLWAINPEAGFFGVAPGTSYRTNPNAMRTVQRDTIFTNVLEAPNRTVWWEGMSDPPGHGADWRGRPWTPGNGDKGAHPNSRFTVPAANCPTLSPHWDAPMGVPVSAILFGGRRAKVAPLVYESFDWAHGVYVGASMASETTAAAAGQVGVVRRDPMAMLPFCGYNMGDYFAHWLEMGRRLTRPPKVFHVNWFRTDDRGQFLWPGFGDNLRVLRWIVDRCHGRAGAVETAIGFLPTLGDIDLDGLDLSEATIGELLRIDRGAWLEDLRDQTAFFTRFGERLPRAILERLQGTVARLSGQAYHGPASPA